MGNSNQKREKFSSRFGFLLISAGCAIGLGNVYRFPIMAGSYGGAIFVLIYLAFLLLLGIPVMVAELAVGRAGKASPAKSFDNLEPKGSKWHFFKGFAIAGNYLLMMFYTTIAGWMVLYFGKYLTGSIMTETTQEGMGNVFGNMVSNLPLMLITTLGVIAVCFLICSFGLQNGVERITKWMMVALFALIVVLAIHSCTLAKAGEGIKFYLIPSLQNVQEAGIMNVIVAAMGQAFFTLSVGIGSIAIFGSYINKDRRLLGEAVTITALDTFIAIVSGLIVFPACFTFNNGVTADASTVGAPFLFTTLSSLFNNMPGGRIWGALFFLFMIFAAFSTVIAVFENIVSIWMDLKGWSRRKVSFINIAVLAVLSLPCIFSLNIWSEIPVLGKMMDLEDFAVSNILLPFGSLVYVLFCTTRYGWGWKNFIGEVNTGRGLGFPKWLRPYMTFILPAIIIFVFIVSVFF